MQENQWSHAPANDTKFRKKAVLFAQKFLGRWRMIPIMIKAETSETSNAPMYFCKSTDREVKIPNVDTLLFSFIKKYWIPPLMMALITQKINCTLQQFDGC